MKVSASLNIKIPSTEKNSTTTQFLIERNKQYCGEFFELHR